MRLECMFHYFQTLDCSVLFLYCLRWQSYIMLINNAGAAIVLFDTETSVFVYPWSVSLLVPLPNLLKNTHPVETVAQC